MSSEGSLLYHIYCDMDQHFTMVISEDLWPSHLLLRTGSNLDLPNSRQIFFHEAIATVPAF